MHVAHRGADLRIGVRASGPPSGSPRAGRRAAGSPAAARRDRSTPPGAEPRAPAPAERPLAGQNRRGCRRQSGRGKSGKRRRGTRTSSACRGKSFFRLYCGAAGSRFGGQRVRKSGNSEAMRRKSERLVASEFHRPSEPASPRTRDHAAMITNCTTASSTRPDCAPSPAAAERTARARLVVIRTAQHVEQFADAARRRPAPPDRSPAAPGSCAARSAGSRACMRARRSSASRSIAADAMRVSLEPCAEGRLGGSPLRLRRRTRRRSGVERGRIHVDVGQRGGRRSSCRPRPPAAALQLVHQLDVVVAAFAQSQLARRCCRVRAT